MELVRCDLCGKEIEKRRGNKIKIEYGQTLFRIQKDFEIDLCENCTTDFKEKVKKNRRAASEEIEQEETQ